VLGRTVEWVRLDHPDGVVFEVGSPREQDHPLSEP
jgi:hypothetical protein